MSAADKSSEQPCEQSSHELATEHDAQPRPTEPHANEETGPIPESLPDTFAEFMADGDVQRSPTNFFTGLFRKATDTLESSLQQAQQSSTDVLNTAQTAGSSAFSAVSGIVRDLGNGLTEDSQSPPPATTGFSSTTRLIKSFRIPSTPILFLPPTDVVCKSSLCHVSATGRTVQRIVSPDLSHLEAVHVECAARISNTQVVLGLENGGLTVLSIASPVPILACESVMENSKATALYTGANIVVVGTNHGYTKVLNVSDLSVLQTITPPEICAVQLGAAFRYASVSCVSVSQDMFVLIGYDDGAVQFLSMIDAFVRVSFIAHSRRVSGVKLFYKALAVTIGNEADPSLAVFDAYTGRCLRRRMLPYVPHSVTTSSFNRSHEEGLICPSEMNLMVGGEEGQVEVFRLVVLSLEKVELQLVKTFSDRVRGKNRAIIQIEYFPDQALLLALSVNGELRRWQLSKEDGCNLALLEEELLLKPAFTEANIVNAADQDFSLPDGGKLNSMGDVIRAQNILAVILDDERIPEAEKDRLVSEFQKRQAEMLVATSQGDTELRRARRRIIARFDTGLRASSTNGTPTNIQMAKAAKRMATFEIEFATRRHAESQNEIQQEAMTELKSILQNFLKRLPNNIMGDFEQIRRDVDVVDREDAGIA